MKKETLSLVCPGGLQHGQYGAAYLDLLAVLESFARHGPIELCAEGDARLGGMRQFAEPRDEVRMHVRGQRPADPELVLLCERQDFANVARRIDDDGLAFVSDQVAGLSQWCVVEAVEQHVGLSI